MPRTYIFPKIDKAKAEELQRERERAREERERQERERSAEIRAGLKRNHRQLSARTAFNEAVAEGSVGERLKKLVAAVVRR
jgi:hypothetical protein